MNNNSTYFKYIPLGNTKNILDYQSNIISKINSHLNIKLEHYTLTSYSDSFKGYLDKNKLEFTKLLDKMVDKNIEILKQYGINNDSDLKNINYMNGFFNTILSVIGKNDLIDNAKVKINDKKEIYFNSLTDKELLLDGKYFDLVKQIYDNEYKTIQKIMKIFSKLKQKEKQNILMGINKIFIRTSAFFNILFPPTGIIVGYINNLNNMQYTSNIHSSYLIDTIELDTYIFFLNYLFNTDSIFSIGIDIEDDRILSNKKKQIDNLIKKINNSNSKLNENEVINVFVEGIKKLYIAFNSAKSFFCISNNIFKKDRIYQAVEFLIILNILYNNKIIKKDVLEKYKKEFYSSVSFNTIFEGNVIAKYIIKNNIEDITLNSSLLGSLDFFYFNFDGNIKKLDNKELNILEKLFNDNSDNIINKEEEILDNFEYNVIKKKENDIRIILGNKYNNIYYNLLLEKYKYDKNVIDDKGNNLNKLFTYITKKLNSDKQKIIKKNEKNIKKEIFG